VNRERSRVLVLTPAPIQKESRNPGDRDQCDRVHSSQHKSSHCRFRVRPALKTAVWRTVPSIRI